MADLSITAADVAPVKVIEQFTGPAAEVITAGTYVRRNTSTGKIEKGNASSVAEARKGGIAINGANVAGITITAVRKGLIDLGDALGDMAYDADVYLSATDGVLADADAGVNEVQTATITGTPTGGDFTLTFGGQTTSAIAYNATAATVQTALEALTSIRKGNVVVSGSAGGPYTVTFQGELAKTNVAAMTASGAGLTGGTTPGVTIATQTAGVQSVIVGTVVPVFGATTADKLLRVDL